MYLLTISVKLGSSQSAITALNKCYKAETPHQLQLERRINQNGGYKPQNEKIRKVQWLWLSGYDCLYGSEKHRAREGEKIRA